MKKERKFGSILTLAAMLIFFYGPIIVMIVFSFNSSKSLTSWTGFSTDWYSKLFESRDIMDAVSNSVSIAIIATIISTIVGTLTAIGISRHKPLVRKIYLNINNLPVLNPEIVTAIET